MTTSHSKSTEASGNLNPSPELFREIDAAIDGEVYSDRASRAMYATDASMYRVMPLGVCYPAHEEDIETIVNIASDESVPVLPRGGGTSLAGQSVGKALILDCSRHMNQVLRVNSGAGKAVVQPGTVLDQLNSVASRHGLSFGPDVATHKRATLGGMAGNNSAGAHSIAYGQTVDHIDAVRAVIPGGRTIVLGPKGTGMGDDLIHLPEPEREIAQRLMQLIGDHREEIDRRFPNILRNVAGYNLDRFVRKEKQDMNLADIMVGSEGTLGVFTELTVNLVEPPPKTVLGAVQFDDLWNALDAVQHILKTDPYAVELVDQFLMNLARENRAYSRYTHFLDGNPEAILLVEYGGSSLETLHQQLDELEELGIGELHAHEVTRMVEPEEQKAAWKVREGGLGIVMSMKGDPKPAAFVEDAAVPVEHLEAFGRDFLEILNRHNLDAAFYGHASVGLLHIRPVLNLKKEKDRRKLKPVLTEVAESAESYGGTYSGEHGEGRARSWFNEPFYGETITNIFREIKREFDPENLMNPGNIVEPGRMDTDFRFELGSTESFHTYLDHSEQGGLQRSIEFCNGNGLCRKTDEGTMCPSYMATRKEEDSTRGRANALREALMGNLGPDGLSSKELYRVMDLCIGCKACKDECPSSVDMARLKFEFLCHYNREHGISFRDALLGHAGKLVRWLESFPGARRIASLFSGGMLERAVKTLLDFHPSRPLPSPSQTSLFTWFRNQPKTEESSNRKPVRLFVDSFSGYLSAPVSIAACKLLRYLGYEPILEKQPCCGRTYFSKGMYESWKNTLEACYRQLCEVEKEEIPVLVLEPSCYSSLVDDSRYLLSDDKVRRLKDTVYLFDDFLLNFGDWGEARTGNEEDSTTKQVLVHPHCHQRAVQGTDPLQKLLERVDGVTAQFLDAGCCGMAGSFGYENEHYHISKKMAEDRLIEKINQFPEDGDVLAPGYSCRHQIKDLTNRTALHPIEFLANNLV